MKKITNPNEGIWYLAYSTTNDVYHWGELEPNQEIITGQPNLEQFATEALLELRVDSFKGNGYYSQQSNNIV